MTLHQTMDTHRMVAAKGKHLMARLRENPHQWKGTIFTRNLIICRMNKDNKKYFVVFKYVCNDFRNLY